jgi:methionine S-methyltransferase
LQVLLHELLAFQIPDRRPLHVRPPAPESPDVRSRFIGFTENARRAFSHPALQHLEPLDGLQTVPMNMGENALLTPTPVKRFAFESFARQNISDAESDPRPEILEILQQRLGARPEKAHEVHLGDGVAPLVARLLAACAEEGGTLFYPRWV